MGFADCQGLTRQSNYLPCVSIRRSAKNHAQCGNRPALDERPAIAYTECPVINIHQSHQFFLAQTTKKVQEVPVGSLPSVLGKEKIAPPFWKRYASYSMLIACYFSKWHFEKIDMVYLIY
jgi:hypothetical protein